jgi:hypothetical protein
MELNFSTNIYLQGGVKVECQFTICPFEEVKTYDVEKFISDIQARCDGIVGILAYIQQDHTGETMLWDALNGVVKLVESLHEITEKEQSNYDLYVEQVNNAADLVKWFREEKDQGAASHQEAH